MIPIVKIKTKDLAQSLNEVLTTKEEKIIVTVVEYPMVYTSVDDEHNDEYCKTNNIPLFDIPKAGGVIVCGVGDIGLSISRKNGWHIGPDFIKFMYDIFTEALPNNDIKIDGNDIIIDGFKVMSNSSVNADNFKEDALIITTVHINMNSDLELINNICLKPMNKVPKGLYEFGFTTPQMLELSNIFLQGVQNGTI